MALQTTKSDLFSNNEAWRSYCLYGLELRSNFPFASHLASGSGPPDLTFTCCPRASFSVDLDQLLPVYSSSACTDAGESIATFYRLETYDILRFTGEMDFLLWPDHIICHLLDSAFNHMVEIHLLGEVLSLWLEQQGIRALHASAVSVNDTAVAFLSNNYGGKTSLALTLVQAGHPLLTDDILPVERRQDKFFGRPGFPQVRLWPDEALHFLGHFESFQQAHPDITKRRIPVGPTTFGTFYNCSIPLTHLYLPERRNPAKGGTTIEIAPVSQRDGLIELVRHSFAPRILQAIGLQPQRLDYFVQMLHKVSMRRITYPSGFEHLSHVGDAILEDLTYLG